MKKFIITSIVLLAFAATSFAQHTPPGIKSPPPPPHHPHINLHNPLRLHKHPARHARPKHPTPHRIVRKRP